MTSFECAVSDFFCVLDQYGLLTAVCNQALVRLEIEVLPFPEEGIVEDDDTQDCHSAPCRDCGEGELREPKEVPQWLIKDVTKDKRYEEDCCIRALIHHYPIVHGAQSERFVHLTVLHGFDR